MAGGDSMKAAWALRARNCRFYAWLVGIASACHVAPARAEPSAEHGQGSLAPAPSLGPKSQPRTTDELVQLYATGVGYAALSGWWVRELGDGHSVLGVVLPAAGVSALAVGATTWLDHSDGLTLGLPQSIATDTLIGFEIASAWVWRADTQASAGHEPSSTRQMTLLWSGATVGAVVGAARYALSPREPARAAFTGSMTLWTGALSGLVAGALTPHEAARDDNASLSAAIGLEAGVVLSSFLGRWLDPSIGWVRALDVGASLGATLAGGVYMLVGDGSIDDRTTLALAAAGLTTGVASAVLLAPRLGLPRAAEGLSLGPDFALGSNGVGVSLRGLF